MERIRYLKVVLSRLRVELGRAFEAEFSLPVLLSGIEQRVAVSFRNLLELN